jgi:hypothetical protein
VKAGRRGGKGGRRKPNPSQGTDITPSAVCIDRVGEGERDGLSQDEGEALLPPPRRHLRVHLHPLGRYLSQRTYVFFCIVPSL